MGAVCMTVGDLSEPLEEQGLGSKTYRVKSHLYCFLGNFGCDIFCLCLSFLTCETGLMLHPCKGIKGALHLSPLLQKGQLRFREGIFRIQMQCCATLLTAKEQGGLGMEAGVPGS